MMFTFPVTTLPIDSEISFVIANSFCTTAGLSKGDLSGFAKSSAKSCHRSFLILELSMTVLCAKIFLLVLRVKEHPWEMNPFTHCTATMIVKRNRHGIRNIDIFFKINFIAELKNSLY